jgi:hypothetical protein
MTVTFNTDNAVITSTGTNSPGSISLFGSIPLALDLAGVAVIPFTPYEPTQSRVHWTQIETSSINGDPHVPPMRAMINAFDSARGVNTIASEAHINAARGGLEGDGSANPALNRNVFSAYLALPSNNSTYSGTVGDKLQASLSLLDQDIPYVGAGSVTIDRIRIGSFPADVMP